MVWGCFAASGPGWLAIIDGTMNSALNRKSWRRMSGCQFVTSSSSALELCSRTMIPNTPASPPLNGSRKIKLVLEWPNQSPDLNLTEMLWHDLKQTINAWKPSNVAELKQFCKEEWAKFLHSDVKDSLPVIANAWLQLLLERVVQPVIRFRGKLLFYLGPGRFGQLFPLINEIIISKLHFVFTRVIFV